MPGAGKASPCESEVMTPRYSVGPSLPLPQLPTNARAGICEAGVRQYVSRGIGDLTIYRACETIFILG